jgi:hypothetical protein
MRLSTGDLLANLYDFRLCVALLQQNVHIVQLDKNGLVLILILSFSVTIQAPHLTEAKIINKTLNILQWDITIVIYGLEQY